MIYNLTIAGRDFLNCFQKSLSTEPLLNIINRMAEFTDLKTMTCWSRKKRDSFHQHLCHYAFLKHLFPLNHYFYMINLH